MQPPNVYSGHYRFLDFRGGGNLRRILWEAASTMKTRLSSGSNLRDRASADAARPGDRRLRPGLPRRPRPQQPGQRTGDEQVQPDGQREGMAGEGRVTTSTVARTTAASPAASAGARIRARKTRAAQVQVAQDDRVREVRAASNSEPALDSSDRRVRVQRDGRAGPSSAAGSRRESHRGRTARCGTSCRRSIPGPRSRRAPPGQESPGRPGCRT
jgi:hypothetical protein